MKTIAMRETCFFFFLPSKSNERPRQNFSLQYQYKIKRTSDEKKEKYQLGKSCLADLIANCLN